MSNIRSFKDVENGVHQELYNNLYLLRSVYKTSPEFDRIFKRDMFVKNNKAAFQEVVHYLLDILNPQLTKEKLSTWPPYDVKGETKFRNDVLKYVNDLNSLYKHANIPPIMTSHLISPGGLKFTKFMLKLSQLVVYEHLQKKHNDTLLHCPDISSKHLDAMKELKNNFQKIILCNESKTAEMVNGFKEHHKNQQEKAQILVNNLKELDKSVSASKREKSVAEEEFYKKYTVYPSNDSLRSKITYLKQEWESLSSIHALFEESKRFLNFINTTNLTIDLNEGSKTSTNVQSQEIHLSEFFNRLTSLIISKSLDFPNPDIHYIEENFAKIRELSDTYGQIKKDLLVSKQNSQLLIAEMLESLKFVEHLTQNRPTIDCNFSVDMQGIAPLEDTP